MAVLTDDKPSEQFGIDTIEDVARVAHRDLNAARPVSNEVPAWRPGRNRREPGG